MSREKPRVIAVVVHVPIDLALGIYRETGDLPISEFPCILKFAETIAEVLDVGHVENGKNAELTFFIQGERKIPVPTRHK